MNHRMESILSYFYLFVLSFLAATVIPLGSEWYLIKILLDDSDPFLSVTTASAGNYLGALTTYYIGVYGFGFLSEKILRMNDETINKAKARYRKYGSWTLLFSWVPVIGDPLCLVGGMLGIRLKTFSLLVLTGKVLRYTAIAYLTLKVNNLDFN